MRCYAPDPARGANSTPPNFLAGFGGRGKGVTVGKREREKRKGLVGKEMERKKAKGKTGEKRRRDKGNFGRRHRKGKERGKREKGEREEFCAVVIFPY